MELDPIYVRFRTEVPTHRGDDPSDYFTVLGGAVVLFKDDSELEIGDCSGRLVHLSRAEEHAVSWHHGLDSLDATAPNMRDFWIPSAILPIGRLSPIDSNFTLLIS